MEKIKIQINFHSHWDIMNPKDLTSSTNFLKRLNNVPPDTMLFVLRKSKQLRL